VPARLRHFSIANIVGTIAECVTRCSPWRSQRSASNLSADDGGRTEADCRGDARLGRRVVQRRRVQERHALAQSEQELRELHDRERVARLAVEQGAKDPLGLPGGARRVEHRGSELLVVDGRRGERGERVGQRLERSLGFVEAVGEPAFDVRAARRQLAGRRFAIDAATTAPLSLMMYATVARGTS
jgi:hypothetical protein